MHDPNDSFDIKLDEISKIEGAASLEIKIRDRKITDLKFSISEWKRFYTQAIRGKPATAIPQLVARICGTCSHAHLLCSFKAIENAFNIIPSSQTQLLRELLYYGLLIRDHALHLYLFALPDIYGKNSLLDFDEGDQRQKQLLEDAFAVKEAGNQLSIAIGGRSVHASSPTIGGFFKLPKIEEIKNIKVRLIDIRLKILDLIDIFVKTPFTLKPYEKIIFSALSSDNFSFLKGEIKTSDGQNIKEEDLRKYLNAVIIPYSHARGFTFGANLMMVGALARINLAKNYLHPNTKKQIRPILDKFPSNNLFDNNLAQAIEILHAIDSSLEIIDNLDNIRPLPLPKITPIKAVGTAVIEAPRGTLYHQYKINEDGIVTEGEIIVPTGQNQVLIEKSLFILVEKLLKENASKEKIILEAEKLIRAFDPCMSCASHFLKVKWS